MSTKVTSVMLEKYKDDAEPIGFLAGQFTVPVGGFHNSEQVEIDVQRGSRKIAIAVQDLSTGARMNSSELFTNKSFKPAILRESAVINAFDLISRNAGEDPFESPEFQENAIVKAVSVGTEMNEKIQRTIELQCSQVLQTGKILLSDAASSTIYELDFKAKVSHFPTVAITWGAAGDTKINDLLTLCKEINKDGKRRPDMLQMGEAAYEALISDDTLVERLDLRRLEGSGIVPMQRLGNGGIYRGTIEVGNWKLDIWTYDGMYEDPTDGINKDYIDTNNVIVRASMGRMDITFGAIPKIGGRDSRVPSALYGRISSKSDIIDLQLWATILGNGDGLEI